MPSGSAITFAMSGLPRSTPSVPPNTSMSMRASGHAALMERATGVASSTSPMRRMQITSTLEIAVNALRRAHAVRMQQLVEALLVVGELAAVALAVPQVEDGRGESRGLLAHAGAIQT